MNFARHPKTERQVCPAVMLATLGRETRGLLPGLWHHNATNNLLAARDNIRRSYDLYCRVVWLNAVRVCLLLHLCTTTLLAAADRPVFKIKVVDAQTGRGVPMVELETVNNIKYYTDSNGIAAFDEPGLMGQQVFFYARSHGYEFRKDGFGYAGTRLNVQAGGSAQIKIDRVNIAERLYRITGGGIYRDSLLAGEPIPIREPLLNGQVFGQDSVMVVKYRGRLYWFWGDTNRPKYPLGHFQTSGATSDLPGQGGLDPSAGINLTYFVDKDGFSRAMVPMKAPGVVWIEGLLTVPDPSGRERMVARYTRMKDLGTMLEHGLIVFNDDTKSFEKLVEFDLNDKERCPQGHPIRVKDQGTDYFQFPIPHPVLRVKADWSHLTNAASYEAFTCLAPGTRFEKAKSRVERDANGGVVYGWKTNTSPTGTAEERQLIAAGRLKQEEARFQLTDVDTDKPVTMHAGSVNWNEFRRKWIMIAVQTGGTSFLGEVWFAEADSPTGPWKWARKIVTHNNYSFYNPDQHTFFDQDGGRLIYFEGTYTHTFSKNKEQTPRYDYNQIMYRLDLASPRLGLPLKPR